MNTREITLVLPDALAREAEASGLLTSQMVESLLREEIRRRRIDKFFEIANRLAGLEFSPLTEQEIEAEIQAVRESRHR
jgi:hypothetical protein